MSDDHKLISTPVSFSEGVKRTDRHTWGILMVMLALAVALVLVMNWIWGGGPPLQYGPATPAPAPTAQPSHDEPRVLPVAPPSADPRRGR